MIPPLLFLVVPSPCTAPCPLTLPVPALLHAAGHSPLSTIALLCAAARPSPQPLPHVHLFSRPPPLDFVSRVETVFLHDPTTQRTTARTIPLDSSPHPSLRLTHDGLTPTCLWCNAACASHTPAARAQESVGGSSSEQVTDIARWLVAATLPCLTSKLAGGGSSGYKVSNIVHLKYT